MQVPGRNAALQTLVLKYSCPLFYSSFRSYRALRFKSPYKFIRNIECFCLSPEYNLIQAQELCVGYRRDAPDGLEDGVKNFAVQAHQRNCLRALRGSFAAQGKRGDVDAVFSQHRSDLPDDAGLVPVAQI